MSVVYPISGHFPWLKRTLRNFQLANVKNDLKYIVDAILAIIEERRHQKTEFKVIYFIMELSYKMINTT